MALIFLSVPPILYIATISLLASTTVSIIPLITQIAHTAFHAIRAAICIAYITLSSQLEIRDTMWFANVSVAVCTIAYNIASVIVAFDLVCPVFFVEWYSMVVLTVGILQVGVCAEETAHGSGNVPNMQRVCTEWK